LEIFQQYKVGKTCLLINIKFLFDFRLNAEVRELENLVCAANWEVKNIISLKRKHPHPKYFCGCGKLSEIKKVIHENKIDLVIFNHNISSSQEKNIEELICCKVIDRTRLILEIFSQRARTYEGKLQVELAKLNYASTRLVNGWSHLERQKGGTTSRSGPGETQLELDRRALRRRISQITRSLEKVKKQRYLSRSFRKKNEVPTVAFVGYTNAGKSTLFNQISDNKLFVKNQLFSTLDPTLRRCFIPRLGNVVLSDTVGFIRNLPHNLIEAFGATLEEVKEADILVHVIDYSDSQYLSYITQVNEVLLQLNVTDKPIILVYNKTDLCHDTIDLKKLRNPQKRSTEIYLSAKEGMGIDHLLETIADHFNQNRLTGTVILNPRQTKIRSQLYTLGAVSNEKIISENGNYQLNIVITRSDFDKISHINKLKLI
jgi:GTP-binding protein HflX